MKIYLVLLTFILIKAISPTVAEPSKPQCVAYGKDSKNGAKVVSTCLDDYEGGSEVKSKCSSTDDLSDPLMATMVTDTSSSVTYQNIYCAECNNVPPEQMKFWNIGLYCESLRSLEVDDDFVKQHMEYKDGKWGATHEGKFHECDLSFKKPDDLSVKECRTRRSSNCPPSWQKNAVKQACSSCNGGNSPLKDFHCLICNSEPDVASVCGGGKSERTPNMRLSFPLLMDISQCNNRKVGEAADKLCCNDGETWDPFFEKCREVVCAIPGHRLYKGKFCIKGTTRAPLGYLPAFW